MVEGFGGYPFILRISMLFFLSHALIFYDDFSCHVMIVIIMLTATRNCPLFYLEFLPSKLMTSLVIIFVT